MSLADLNEYLDGFSHFKVDWYTKRGKPSLALKSHKPKVLIITCSDSRVDPAHLFDTDPGDFFVIRNVANLVPPYIKGSRGVHGVSAALEYAVCRLKVKDIIVMGHAHCGGVKTLISEEDEQDSEFLGPWLDIAKPAFYRVKVMEHQNEDALHEACEKEGVIVSLSNLLTFPWLRERVDSGELGIHGWYFNMDKGLLELWSPKDRDFITWAGTTCELEPKSE